MKASVRLDLPGGPVRGDAAGQTGRPKDRGSRRKVRRRSDEQRRPIRDGEQIRQRVN